MDGTLKLLQEVKLSSEESDYGAEIMFNSAGDRLYASSRGTGVLIVFKFDMFTEKLELIEQLEQHGSWPRHFAMDDENKIIVTTDQKGHSIQVLHIDQTSGLLVPGKHVATEENPAFVTFL